MTNTPDPNTPDPKGVPGGLGPVAAAELCDSPEGLRRCWRWLLATGIALVIGGTAAIAMPFIASVAIEAAAGVIMLAGGALQLVQLVSVEEWRAKLWAGLSGLLYIVGGVLLLMNPLAGLIALTLMLAAIFIVDGATRVMLGVKMRPEHGWGWMAAGGLISVGLGLAIVAMAPGISLTLLGLLAGVSFIFEGWSFIFLARALRKAGAADAPS